MVKHEKRMSYFVPFGVFNSLYFLENFLGDFEISLLLLTICIEIPVITLVVIFVYWRLRAREEKRNASTLTADEESVTDRDTDLRRDLQRCERERAQLEHESVISQSDRTKLQGILSIAGEAINDASALKSDVRNLVEKTKNMPSLNYQASVFLRKIASVLEDRVKDSIRADDAVSLIGETKLGKEQLSAIESLVSTLRIEEMPLLQFDEFRNAITRASDRIAREDDKCHPGIPEFFRKLAQELIELAERERNSGNFPAGHAYAQAAKKLAQRVEELYESKYYHGLLEVLKK